ncbi:MAG: Xaa-Pro dipeptidase, partial [Deltaproteobacteria bacterium]
LFRDHIDRLEREYARALDAAGFDAVVIHSGRPALQSSFDDQHWPHRPTPYFLHWAPLREPDAAIVIVPGRRPRLVRVDTGDYWEGSAPVDGDHFWNAFDLVVANTANAAAREAPAGRVAFLGDDAARADAWGIAPGARNPAALVRALDAVRAVKSPYERACIAEANRRAAPGHAAVAEAFAAGERSELALHLTYLQATGQDDADTPYKNIVAIGHHAAILHHVHYAREHRGAAASLLVDAGATCFGYHADITRTHVAGSGAAADGFRALIAAVEALQQQLCLRARAGVAFEHLHDEAHALLAQALVDLDLAVGPADALVDTGITRAFFPHGLGHSLGLQTHDVGCRPTAPRTDNPYLRTTAVLRDGHVVTIEPGCYFIAKLLRPVRASEHAALVRWNAVDAIAPFGGVRIEDDIAIVGDAPHNLTRPALG